MPQHELNYSPRPPRRNYRHLIYVRRPVWRSYLIAYLLIGMGGTLADVAATERGFLPVEIFAAIVACLGLVVFVLAVGWSLWFALGGGRR